MFESLSKDARFVLQSPKRITWFVIGATLLVCAYVFQNSFTLLSVINGPIHPYVDFISKKAIRLILNDAAMLLLIHAWFYDRRITNIAWMIGLIDLLLLFPLYVLIKLLAEGDSEISSPLLSQFHRLIVNPVLILIFIPAVYFQRLRENH